MLDISKIPEELAHLASQARVLVRRDGTPREGGRCVVYWMQRAVRILDNPALDVAIEAANLLGLPVAVYFKAIPNYPHANLRHYHFLQQGLRDVEEDARERGVGFVVRRSPEASLEGFLGGVGAALLVGDENPCREPERWRRVLAGRLRIPFWTVDADVVVPSRVFGKTFVLLHHFRPHLNRELPKYLVASKNVRPVTAWRPEKKLESWDLGRDVTEGFQKLDRSVGPVDSFTGGTHAAMKRLKEFVSRELKDYEERRNHPEVRGTSRLSPYLHFGNIGPVTIALAVREAVRQGRAREEHPSGAKALDHSAHLMPGMNPWPTDRTSSSAGDEALGYLAGSDAGTEVPANHPLASAGEKFLDELIGWRELAVLFVRYEPNYDNWECAAPWARKTLVEHAGDPRPHRYSLAQLERAETADELWNAAQREMVVTGWMHGYMRMYWAKKILEWAPDPARAFEWAAMLNDKYELDGRDPNGYAGIAWAIVGRHDRPWFNRPVFGLVRPMAEGSLRKKFDAERYIGQNSGTGSGA
jgi:deoxyribodipyrimidine photo-lyase